MSGENQAINMDLDKGGTKWVKFAIDRVPQGLRIYVRTDPRVEEFFKSLSAGAVNDLTAYGGMSWKTLNPELPIKVYNLRVNRDTPSYSLNNPHHPLLDPKTGSANLTMLTFVGVGSGAGVTFIISEPCSLDHARTFGSKAVLAAKELIQNYIAPLHLELSISSVQV